MRDKRKRRYRASADRTHCGVRSSEAPAGGDRRGTPSGADAATRGRRAAEDGGGADRGGRGARASAAGAGAGAAAATKRPRLGAAAPAAVVVVGKQGGDLEDDGGSGGIRSASRDEPSGLGDNISTCVLVHVFRFAFGVRTARARVKGPGQGGLVHETQNSALLVDVPTESTALCHDILGPTPNTIQFVASHIAAAVRWRDAGRGDGAQRRSHEQPRATRRGEVCSFWACQQRASYFPVSIVHHQTQHHALIKSDSCLFQQY